jgi:hypothetical protein
MATPRKDSCADHQGHGGAGATEEYQNRQSAEWDASNFLRRNLRKACYQIIITHVLSNREQPRGEAREIVAIPGT